MPLYPRYEQASLNQSTNTNLMSGIVKMVLVNSGLYTYSDTHEFIEDVSNAARVGVSLALTGKSSTNGTFASEAIIFPALIALQANAIILFIDTGNESTSRLVFFSNDVIGLPLIHALNDSATLNIGNYLFTTNTQDASSATKESLGLDLVDNTADINKPISILTQLALDDKQDLLVSGQNIKTINNQSILGSGDVTIAGGGGSPTITILTDAATVTPNVDTTTIGILASLSQNTTIANPIGTPTNYQELVLRITSSSIRRITWGTSYNKLLPNTTSGEGREDYFQFRYNTLDTKWDLVQTNQPFDEVELCYLVSTLILTGNL